MKLNPTLALTLVLLSLMFGAGLVSAAWGLVVGREALKGITQPDTRPANNLGSRQASAPRSEEVVILREDDIITSAKARMAGKKMEAKPATAIVAESKSVNKAEKVAAAKEASFPLVAQSQGVLLEVTAASRQGDALVLKVNLKNSGKQPVQFLYSFLDVRDEQGRALTADAQGLPAELPNSGEAFSGTISLPMALVDQAEKLSLSLTDYPDQKLQLQLSNIPVVK